MKKNIQIDPHTLERALERGVEKSEIIEVINMGELIPAKNNKFAKFKIFKYNKIRNNKYYEEKKVEVVYLIEGELIITVTVYAFYGKWSNK